MKMKSLLLLLLVVPLTTFGKDEIRMNLSFEPGHIILGEPFRVNITLANNTSNPIDIPWQYHIVRAIKWESPEGNIKPIGTMTVGGDIKMEKLDAGKVREYTLSSIEQFGYVPALCKEGIYHIRVILDTNNLQGVKNPIKIESNEVTFTIAEPIGVDLEAYRYLKGHPLNKPQELLSKYPTSTYAAYAFAQMNGIHPVEPLDVDKTRTYIAKLQKTGNKELLSDRTRKIATNEEGKELKDASGNPITITVENWLRDRIERAKKICLEHPKFFLTDQIKYEVIAYDYLELVESQKAYDVFNDLKENSRDDQIRENSEKITKLLSEMGLAH